MTTAAARSSFEFLLLRWQNQLPGTLFGASRWWVHDVLDGSVVDLSHQVRSWSFRQNVETIPKWLKQVIFSNWNHKLILHPRDPKGFPIVFLLVKLSAHLKMGSPPWGQVHTLHQILDHAMSMPCPCQLGRHHGDTAILFTKFRSLSCPN